MLTNNSPKRLYCFSPTVMLITMIIEFGGALYTYWYYRSSLLVKTIITILLCLGTFQLAEYMICTQQQATLWWARVGHAAITLLPPLGLQVIFLLSGKKERWLYWLIYLLPICFSVYFLVIEQAITSGVCLGNYVIFTSKAHTLPYWGLYYYSFLILAIGLCHYYRRRLSSTTTKKTLRWIQIAYLVFLLPTTTINLLASETIKGIASIMCGFAVLMAMILLTKILPLVAKKHQAHSGFFGESIKLFIKSPGNN